jgi:hypothetical protein
VKGGRLRRTRKPGRASTLLCKRVVVTGWTRTPRDVAGATTVTPATGVAGTERPYNGTAEDLAGFTYPEGAQPNPF